MNTIPRIGVYTICKNESKFVRRWVESMWASGRGADRAYILDTGSTDGTVKLFKKTLKDLGIPKDWLKIETKEYSFFRFDRARNDNLKMIPDSDRLDALVSVDLDEIMIPEFWEDLREKVAEHPDFSRIFYLYAWSHGENGEPKRVFWYDKVHPTKGCKWEFPVHEALKVPENYQGEYKLDSGKIYLHHYPDAEKSRGSYLSLLELRAKERADDIYGLYYLMREYQFRDMSSLKALAVGQAGYTKILTKEAPDDYDCLPFFALGIAEAYRYNGCLDAAEFFFGEARKYGPGIRQPYISQAAFLAYSGRSEEALAALEEMEAAAPDSYPTWYENEYNFTWKPLQIRAVAYCWSGNYGEALEIFKAAEEYIRTDSDRREAEAEGFYDDYDWLKERLKEGEQLAV